MKHSQRFIFLEITDPDINGLITTIREILSKKTYYTNVHLTIRGPYYDNIPIEDFNLCNKEMMDEELLLSDFGIFDNDNNYVVYMKVKNEKLKKIWKKQDYPISKYGINPHITLCETTNKKYADELIKYLNKENINLLCHKYRFTQYVSKQNELFNDPIRNEKKFLNLLTNRKISLTFLSRLDKLIKKYNT